MGSSSFSNSFIPLTFVNVLDINVIWGYIYYQKLGFFQLKVTFDIAKLVRIVMAPKFRKCLKIAKQIGDRRVDKFLHEIFCREKKAYMDDSRSYNIMIDEIHARIEERHEIILEVKKFLEGPVLDECLADLKDAEQEDFAEIGRLLQMSYTAAIKVGQKCRRFNKLKKV